MGKPRVVILGAGPAGVGAAYRLRELDRASVTVLEQRDAVGGNAGSFELDGQRLDYGSHRLHPACEPEILDTIRSLLGDDLVLRPRHGRIRLHEKWIHFPLKPVDLFLRTERRFAAGALRDAFSWRSVREAASSRSVRKAAGDDTFSSVLLESLGPTICHSFYFPYARKIWGRDPEDLSAVQARKRVSAHSFAKLLRKVLDRVPGLRRGESGFFYYPRNGYGQISEAFFREASSNGAEFLFGFRVTRLLHPTAADPGWTIEADRGGQRRTLHADFVWSTIPVSLLARMVEPAPPSTVVEAAASLEYRAMLLIYLQLPVDRFAEYDAHYFPETTLSITRLSEPKNYSAASRPRGRTTLCAELPCSPDDAAWSMSDEDLGRLVADDLARAGIPLPCTPDGVHVKRLRQAYPIYARGYERHFAVLDGWVEQLPRLLSYGRQGLFAHDNTHHALAMAYAAADCLTDGDFDAERWQGYRDVFETHVVED